MVRLANRGNYLKSDIFTTNRQTVHTNQIVENSGLSQLKIGKLEFKKKDY